MRMLKDGEVMIQKFQKKGKKAIDETVNLISKPVEYMLMPLSLLGTAGEKASKTLGKASKEAMVIVATPEYAKKLAKAKKAKK